MPRVGETRWMIHESLPRLHSPPKAKKKINKAIYVPQIMLRRMVNSKRRRYFNFNGASRSTFSSFRCHFEWGREEQKKTSAKICFNLISPKTEWKLKAQTFFSASIPVCCSGTARNENKLQPASHWSQSFSTSREVSRQDATWMKINDVDCSKLGKSN